MTKTIHTEFYSKKAETAFKCLWLLLSGDCTKYSLGRQQIRTADHYNVERDTSGEIMLVPVEKYYCGNDAFSNRSDVECRGWIAWQLKIAVQNWLDQHGYSKHNDWKRYNDSVVTWLSDAKNGINLTVSDIYCMYDILNSRNRTDKRYADSQIKELVGQANDPFMTEQENVRRAEIKRINEELKKKLSENGSKCWREREAAENLVKDKWNKISEEDKAKAQAEIDALNKQFDEILQIQQTAAAESQAAA